MPGTLPPLAQGDYLFGGVTCIYDVVRGVCVYIWGCIYMRVYVFGGISKDWLWRRGCRASAERLSRVVAGSHPCTSSGILPGRLQQLHQPPAAFAWQVAPAQLHQLKNEGSQEVPSMSGRFSCCSPGRSCPEAFWFVAGRNRSFGFQTGTILSSAQHFCPKAGQKDCLLFPPFPPLLFFT